MNSLIERPRPGELLLLLGVLLLGPRRLRLAAVRLGVAGSSRDYPWRPCSTTCSGEPSGFVRRARKAAQRRRPWAEESCMLERFDPRTFLARCVRCNERGAPLCAACACVPPARACTPAGHPVLALGRYQSPVGDRVRRLKYADETHLAYPLGRALRQLGTAARADLAGAVLVPVPLHPERLASRGYNQAALIARALTWRGGPRLALALIERQARGVAQAQLSGQERRVNLVDAFVARNLEGHRPVVFLVDDVVTTGSTVDACATILASAGAVISGVLACAIADENARPA